MPTKYAIAAYWSSQWRDLNTKFGKCFSHDLGEPECMACGKSWNGKYDVRAPNNTQADCKAAWEKAPFHRCHMLAKQFGGDDDVSNLLVLCETCHLDSPDVNSPFAKDLMIKWALMKDNWMVEMFRNLEASLAIAGVELADACNAYLEDPKVINEKVGLHGMGFSPSSFGFALAAQVIETKQLTVH